jgi:hypothetical protein
MYAMQFSHSVTSIDRLAPAKTGSIKAATMFLPHFLQTAVRDVNALLSIFGSLANCVQTRCAKASREAGF